MKKPISKFQFITHGSTEQETLAQVETVCKSGGDWIQLRCKGLDKEAFIDLAKKAKSITEKHNAKLIINDSVEVCKIVRADGVHLGQEDMSLQRARMILGKKVIVGLTCNTAEQINATNKNHADYIGLGPFRNTTTKEKLSPVLGLEGYSDILNTRENDIPVIAIGGITSDDLKDLYSTGIHGVAVSGAITNSDNIEEEVEKFKVNTHP